MMLLIRTAFRQIPNVCSNEHTIPANDWRWVFRENWWHILSPVAGDGSIYPSGPSLENYPLEGSVCRLLTVDLYTKSHPTFSWCWPHFWVASIYSRCSPEKEEGGDLNGLGKTGSESTCLYGMVQRQKYTGYECIKEVITRKPTVAYPWDLHEPLSKGGFATPGLYSNTTRHEKQQVHTDWLRCLFLLLLH